MNSLARNSLIWGSLVSLTIIIILLVIKSCCPQLLEIPTQWLAVAAVPLILALIVGRFIKNFKGWGVELELQGNTPIVENSSIIEVVSNVVVRGKEDQESLDRLEQEFKKGVQVLKFSLSKKRYYDSGVLRYYLRELPNVTYFEVVYPKEKFKSLIDISFIRIRQEDHELIQQFINSVETNDFTFFESFRSESFVYSETTVVDTLVKIKSSGKNFIAVLNGNHELIAIATKGKIEEFLANQVIKTLKRKT